VGPGADASERGGWWTGPVEDPRRYVVADADLGSAQTGGEGIVYCAVQATTGDRVALKLLTSLSAGEWERHRSRSAIFEIVRHENLMEHREVFVGCPLIRPGDPAPPDDEFDLSYTVSTWVDGVALSEVATGASVEEKLRWIDDVGRALDHLHGVRGPSTPAGVAHRDVKPSNIRVRDDGRAVLLDFGVARPVDGDLTEGLGTYMWNAPETLGGSPEPAGAAADAWGLGALAHWLFVGDPPRLDGAASSRERIERSLRPHLDARVIAKAVAELLESEPGRRPHDLARWSSRLRHRRAQRPARTLATRIGLVGALLVAALAVRAAMSPGDSDESRSPRTGVTTAVPEATSTTLPPAEVRCRGEGVGLLSSNPPITTTPAVVSFTLVEPSTAIACEDETPEGMTSVYLDGLSVAFSNLTCPDVTGSSDADGKLRMVWSDGRASRGSAQVTLNSKLEGSLTTTIEDGPFTGATGETRFHYAVPIGATQAFTGDCTAGITSETVVINEITFEVPR